MIAPGTAHGKSFVWAPDGWKTGKTAGPRSRSRQTNHNNAQFRSIAGHSGLG